MCMTPGRGRAPGVERAAAVRTLALMGFVCSMAWLEPRAWGQRRVDDRNLGERVVLICPVAGEGTARAPRRPICAPDAAEIGPEAIVSFTSILSDDRKYALVEVVAQNRKALAAILADARAEVKKFDRSRGAKKEDIETEFRKYKRDFSFDKFAEGK